MFVERVHACLRDESEYLGRYLSHVSVIHLCLYGLMIFTFFCKPVNVIFCLGFAISCFSFSDGQPSLALCYMILFTVWQHVLKQNCVF